MSRTVKRLVLLRHGQSIWNAERRVQGQRCAGLSEIGHAQARVTARALADAYPDAHLLASDLRRTVETAGPVAEALGREAIQDAGLRERSFGTWEGRSHAEIAEQDGARFQRFVDGDDAVLEEVGGETSRQLEDRVTPVFRRLLESTPDDGVTIAVTHGGPVWHGTHRLLALPTSTLGGVGNASVTELLLTADGRLLLDRWNQLAHLPLELVTAWRPAARTSAASPTPR